MMDVTTPRVLTIRSAYDDAAKEVTLTIADSGPGIPEEIQSRIFEPFFTTKDIGEGTGVGLAVSHRIVEAHDGRIRVDSTPGKGSVFTVILPVRTAAMVKRPQAPAADAVCPAASFLIIDAEPAVEQARGK